MRMMGTKMIKDIKIVLEKSGKTVVLGTKKRKVAKSFHLGISIPGEISKGYKK